MFKIFLPLVVVLIFASFNITAQNWTEGFETTDTLTLPSGWSKWNRAPFPIDPATHWNVRDTGQPLPGLSTARAKAHTGHRAIGVSWWSSIDTTGNNTSNISDAWLVTKRIHVWAANSYLSFWWSAGGGSLPYLDSFQIWISTVDSTPQSFTHYILTISDRGPYGEFTQEFIPYDDYIGQTIWIAFRYNMDCATDGFFVHLDDFESQNPIGIKPIGNGVPKTFDLKQNYPNPFNPVTNIEFDIAKGSNTKMIIYNEVGQEVITLVDQFLNPGSYKVDFNASKYSSGVYFYRLITDNYVKTNKMILIK